MMSTEEIERLNEWAKTQRLPYTKKLDNGWYEVFDGKSKVFMEESMFKKIQALMLKEGLKNTKP